MCNRFTGALHEGCVSFIIDEWGSLAVATLNAYNGSTNPHPGVSLTLGITHHTLALPGTNLRIVCRSSFMREGTNYAQCDSMSALGHEKTEVGGIRNPAAAIPVHTIQGHLNESRTCASC
ncbi:hypothetical protein CVT26_013845 [Gymnopilus dilepis]|uniref:Thioesterase domain-containing protein n=1 Tax=Gymnopilus dilepis TaxID=231916 RepID=A0A409VVX4_9AGAR|nr:hypothetical protein CVT26_013845 [Gymnopilus dilepis]